MNAVPMRGEAAGRESVDLSTTPLRELHKVLHGLGPDTNRTAWRLLNPEGRHAVAVGLDAPILLLGDARHDLVQQHAQAVDVS